MSCTQIRDALSARLDGEDPGVDEAALYSHLAGCGECRAFAHEAEELHRVVRLEPAPAIPDLAPAVLAVIGEDTRARRHRTPAAAGHDTVQVLRWVLVGLAIVQMAVAIPALLGNDAGLPVHTARHLGSFDLALGFGFLYAAWRPRRISGMLPIVAALVVCLAVSSLLDVASGNTAALGESHHLADFAGLLVMWLIGRETTHAVALA